LTEEVTDEVFFLGEFGMMVLTMRCWCYGVWDEVILAQDVEVAAKTCGAMN
jgi:hypothetical protein